MDGREPDGTNPATRSRRKETSPGFWEANETVVEASTCVVWCRVVRAHTKDGKSCSVMVGVGGERIRQEPRPKQRQGAGALKLEVDMKTCLST